MKRLTVFATVAVLAGLPVSVSARTLHEGAAPAQVKQTQSTRQQPAQPEWAPGCLFIAISTGVSGVQYCASNWQGGCFATVISGAVLDVQSCAP